MQTTLLGKTALVCGASQGIGQAIAQEFAALGGSVIALARTPAALQQVVDQLARPGQHEALAVNLNDSAQLGDAVQGVLERRGHIDILVINSGGPKAGPLLGASRDAFSDALGSHLLAAAQLAALCVPSMQAAKWGRIIVISSTSVKAPLANLGVSNTIRGAMAAWAKTLANEVAINGITVNTILPGYTETSRLKSLLTAEAERQNLSLAELTKQWQATVPCGRFAAPHEIAAVAGFLASPQASYINGVCLPVDGGRTRAL